MKIPCDNSYPFEFVGISKTSADQYQIDTLIYRFRSTKSHHEYEVHIERYVEHLCCIKFFDTTSTYGFGRFSHATNTFEPRTIFRTVAEIATEALSRDPLASFCFIGATDDHDTSDGVRTRRYRVYKAYVRHLGLESLFEMAFFDQHSLILLANRKAVSDIEYYSGQMLHFF